VANLKLYSGARYRFALNRLQSVRSPGKHEWVRANMVVVVQSSKLCVERKQEPRGELGSSKQQLPKLSELRKVLAPTALDTNFLPLFFWLDHNKHPGVCYHRRDHSPSKM
jgi:hypothetical protein